MKKIMGKSRLLVLALLAALFTGLACTASFAAGVQKLFYVLNGKTLYQWDYYTDNMNVGTFRPREVVDGYIYNTLSGEVAVTKASSKKTVMTIELSSVDSGTNTDGSKWAYTTLKTKIKKAGVSRYTLTVKDPKTGISTQKTYEVHVSKYTNPIKSLKIGKKEYASKLAKKPVYKLNKKLSGKLSVKPNTGWTIKKIRLSEGEVRGILSQVPGAALKNNKKVTATTGQAIEIVLYNKKADRYESVCIGGAAGYMLVFGGVGG